MATSRTSRVSVAIGAEVTGARDVDRFADDLGDLPDKQSVTLAAKVTGDKDVSGLSDDLAKMPKSTTAKVAATVTGDDKVDGLTTDLDGLPKNTPTKVAATVSGGQAVDDVSDAVSDLPATTSTKVDATVAGDRAVDGLATDIDGLPTKTTVTVDAKLTSSGGKTPKDLGDEIDDTKGKAKTLGVEGAAFGSQFLGPYSEGAALFGDLAEQLSALKESADETSGMSGSGGLKGILSIAGGLGAGIIAGLLIDQVVGGLQRIAAEQQLVTDAITDTSQALVDNGGAWTASIQQALDAKIAGSDVFQELLSEGTDWGTAMEAITGKLGDPVDAVNQIMTQHGKSLGIMEQGTVRGLSNIADASADAAKDQLDYYKKWGLLTQAQKDAIASSKGAADGVDLVGDAMRDAGSDTDYATGRVKSFNNTSLNDKSSTLKTDDKASPKVDAANKKKLGDKSNTLKSTDKVSPKVDTVNRKDLKDKKSYMTVSDLATAPVDTFNRKPISDKTAIVDADTQPAKDDIDALNGRTVTVPVRIKLADQISTFLFGQAFSASGSSGGGNRSAPDGFAAADASGRAADGLSTPAARSSFTTAPLTLAVAPAVQIIIQGAVDPASTARQVNQILTRAGRRTTAMRTGGRYGPGRAPV